MAAKFPIDKIIVGRADHEFMQVDPDLPGIQVSLNVEVTPHGYLVTRDWAQERDAENELSLYTRERRTIWEKFYFNSDGAVILRVAMSNDWEPVKESRKLQKSDAELKQPDSVPRLPILQPMTGAPKEAFE